MSTVSSSGKIKVGDSLQPPLIQPSEKKERKKSETRERRSISDAATLKNVGAVAQKKPPTLKEKIAYLEKVYAEANLEMDLSEPSAVDKQYKLCKAAAQLATRDKKIPAENSVQRKTRKVKEAVALGDTLPKNERSFREIFVTDVKPPLQERPVTAIKIKDGAEAAPAGAQMLRDAIASGKPFSLEVRLTAHTEELLRDALSAPGLEKLKVRKDNTVSFRGQTNELSKAIKKRAESAELPKLKELVLTCDEARLDEFIPLARCAEKVVTGDLGGSTAQVFFKSLLTSKEGPPTCETLVVGREQIDQFCNASQWIRAYDKPVDADIAFSAPGYAPGQWIPTDGLTDVTQITTGTLTIPGAALTPNVLKEFIKDVDNMTISELIVEGHFPKSTRAMGNDSSNIPLVKDLTDKLQARNIKVVMNVA